MAAKRQPPNTLDITPYSSEPAVDCQSVPAAELSPDAFAWSGEEEWFSDEEEYEARKKKRRHGAFWKRRPFKIYADNFGFGVNRYQCMIDYIDKKDSGECPDKSEIRLPLLEERCLDNYSSKRPFRFYENDDIDFFIRKGEHIRDQIRQNDVATSGNVIHRTHTNWSMTKKDVQLVKDSKIIDHRKDREIADRKARGLLERKTLKTVGLSFALDSMDPMNLNLMTAHNNLDHAIYMTSRRDRLADIDEQLGHVIGDMQDGADDINRRAKREASGRNRSSFQTPYDSAQSMGELSMMTEDVATRNRVRRKLELEELEEGVNNMMMYDRSRNRMRNNLRELDDSIHHMEGSVGAMLKRHKIERGYDEEIPVAVLSSLAKKKARTMLNLDVHDDDVHDPELARLRMRRRHRVREESEQPEMSSFEKKLTYKPDVISDVQTRVMQRAGQINGRTSTQSNVYNRAKYINIYVPRHCTADPNCIVQPSRTELNIDHMAKTLAAKGKIQRRFDVDDETDLPASALNTYSFNLYNRQGAIKPPEIVPSNSLRVRSAVCRARQRNAIAGR